MPRRKRGFDEDLSGVVATVVARSTPTVSAVASFSTQHISRRPSGSRSKEGQRQGVWSSRKCGQRFPRKRHVTMQRDSQLQFRNNAFQCFQIKLSRQPDPESPNSSKCSPRWAKRTTCTLPSRKHSRRPSTKHENNIFCERIQSTKSFVERKQKRVEQAKKATEKTREALNLAMASQKEEEKLLAEGERSPTQSSLQRQR